MLAKLLMMIINPLDGVSLQDVLPVFLKAFEGYFVPMPTSIDYWASRFDLALVDFSASYGAFHNGELVAFIIHAIDQKQGRKVGFNTGTGVLPAFRGQHLVDQMYHKAFDDLARQGVHRFELEVIVENHAAIAVYERLGFKVSRTFKCYSGGPKTPSINLKCVGLPRQVPRPPEH